MKQVKRYRMNLSKKLDSFLAWDKVNDALRSKIGYVDEVIQL